MTVRLDLRILAMSSPAMLMHCPFSAATVNAIFRRSARPLDCRDDGHAFPSAR